MCSFERSFIMTVQSISFRENIVSPPKRVPTQAEIFAEKNRIQAEKAKEKPREERSLDDKIAIVTDTINKVTTNVPVLHANSINYLS